MSYGPHINQGSNAPQRLCIYQVIEKWAEQTPNAVAILAPGRAPLTYGHLHRHINDVIQTLHIMGLGCNDRVALVLPNGPEMVAAFLAVAACTTCVPLNPAYVAKEFDFYLAHLHAKAVITQAGIDSQVRAVAPMRGLSIIELIPTLQAKAGVFRLAGKAHPRTAHHGFAQPNDVALIVHTSGTTSQPKIVPLTHANICAAAYDLCSALQLVKSDRCLNVMPLFHPHGLIGGMLTSLMVGASVVCTSDFSASQFFTWMAEFCPTWYTAVPTIHQAIVARAALHPEVIMRHPLRFIRSASAPLPMQVLAELERMFNAPVIEGYGTNEAPLTTSNLLLPYERKIGSVGIAAGSEVTIMDEVGTLLPAGEIGEIVIRGPNVFQGYENNPAANRSAFTHGWFRTGDEGYLDADGYLFITGRLKEIINRGGEKIAPREIEEILMEHPAITEVAAFAMPHAQLGEDVAIAIVLHQNTSATTTEIREFAAARLADFKVPRQVIFVNEIPKSATGKIQRIGMAERLGLLAPGETQPEAKTAFIAPRTPIEAELARIWAQVFGLERIGIYDDFFELGGHSLQAVSLFTSIEQVIGKKLPIATLLQAPTVAQLATLLGQEGELTSRSSLVPIQPVGSKPPLFFLPGHTDNLLTFRDLAHYLGREQPVYGLQAPSLEGKQAPYTPVEEIATRYIQEILMVQPQGPFFLVGFCFGSLVAFEMAQQLHKQGHEDVLLILVEPYRRSPKSSSITSFLKFRVESVRLFMFHLENLAQFRPKKIVVYVGKAVQRRIKKKMWRIEHRWFQRFGHVLPPAPGQVEDNNSRAASVYSPKVYPGRIIFFLDSETPVRGPHNPVLAWGDLTAGGLEVHRVTGKWMTIFREPHVQVLAEQLKACLEQAQAKAVL